MRTFDSLPKSFKKTARYIRQEASLEQLKGLEVLLSRVIYQRMQELTKREIANKS